ncbi:hypothetical protein [Paraflavitalea pollutisoli]|uniref:hypothetical protein n=1 Tax=Paraflavitalea pollutisoli TaxID=3034143 RepID=UPI0023EB55BF|nr:hypothetical protein [Paraflavitalea sp. H1-2-19X]
MKRSWLYIMLAAFFAPACDKENDDLVTPLSANAFPQIVVFDDEGDGGLEDEDAFSFKLTLLDRNDSTGKEPAGRIIPLKEAVTVNFKVIDFQGFSKIADYIKAVKALYEIDDCTTSEDKGIDVPVQFDVTTGIGSVSFPAGVEEVEVEFEVDEDLFDDKLFNTKKRELTFQLTGITGNNTQVQANKTAAFNYSIQDDEGIYGEWEVDHKNAAEFARFKALFGLVNEDIKNLQASEVDEIAVEFEYGEVKVVVKLVEEEDVEECGSVERKNKEIEIEASIEDLTDDELEGDVEFGEKLELDNSSIAEFVYKGTFKVTGKKLVIVLKGELDDEETSKVTLTLEK